MCDSRETVGRLEMDWLVGGCEHGVGRWLVVVKLVLACDIVAVVVLL